MGLDRTTHLELIYVAKNDAAKKDFQRRGTRSARRFKTSTYIRPTSVNSMGGYYTVGTQRVDMLDRVSKKSRN